MASLKETKGRIASVKSTLKITSAMKMVASAKLHKAQNAIESMLPYERRLREMLQLLLRKVALSSEGTPETASSGRVAIVALASNSSLCGGFNSNIIRELKARIGELEKEGIEVEVYSVGKKLADAMKKSGYPSAKDWNDLVAHSSYAGADALAKELQQKFNSGTYRRVEIIYNHFVTTANQQVVRETYLPMAPLSLDAGASREWPEDLIIEPSPEEMLADLLPRVRSLRIYTAILDSCAAEHAARTVAMQTATDNGEDILQDLTLEYNKGRQQKITSELLDIVGGSMQ